MPSHVTPLAIDSAAAALRCESRAFTRRNLFHAVRRVACTQGQPPPTDFDEFCAGALATRLRAGPVAGLLPLPTTASRRRVPSEWEAYFPAAILLVDRVALVSLIAASGALVQSRVAPIALDGTPAHVVGWLRRGFLAGQRAPIAYLHDAATVVYPFVHEPLATLIAETHGDPLPYRDLGLPPDGLLAGSFPFASALIPDEPIVELEQLPPAALVAYAVRGALALVPPDPLLAPLSGRKRSKR